MVSVVTSSCGDVVGMTWMSAACGSLGSFGNAGDANFTPGSAAMASASFGSAAASAGSSMRTTAMSGPLKPGPKPSDSRS